MAEEEKKAIKYLKNEIERVNKENNFKKMPKEIVCIPLFLTYSETLLNLIEKLQKENEKYKENYIPKSKIIKNIDKDIAEWKELMLSDENDRTKNIWTIECNARRSAYEELLKEE